MGFFRSSSVATAPTYTGLQLQTSTNTLPIPLVWGQAKVSVNVIWYANFQVSGAGGKGKGFFHQSSQQITYSADVILALCEGTISAIGTIWRDQSVYTLAELGLTLFDGAPTQPLWSYLEDTYPNQALAYQSTAFVCAASYQLGASAEISNHNFEVIAQRHGSGANGIDADPAGIIYDFLFSPIYGVGLPSEDYDSSTLFGSSGDASLQSYCFAVGIALSPALIDQEQASSVLTRWLQLCNCAAVWSAGRLRFIPYGDTAIVAGTNITQTIQYAVPIPVTPETGAPTPAPQIVVASSAAFVADGGVIYLDTGSPLTYAGAGDLPLEGQYCINPPGTYLFDVLDSSKTVAITFTYAIQTGYTPDLSPIYSLTDSDFVLEPNTDPVQLQRVDPFSLPTIQRIEISDRNQAYDLAPIEARDQSQIELFGPRVGSTITAHEICDGTVVAPIVAQLILQRNLYVRKTATFKLGWEFCLLDPMDVVSITDANLGLNEYAVRIRSIEEDDKGVLTFTCEELTVGVSTAALYPIGPSSGAGGVPNRGSQPSLVNATPLIYEPPAPVLEGGPPQIWLGCSGGASGVNDPNFGGAYVYASLDDSTYSASPIATLSRPMIQGALTAGLALASGYDTTNTLSVDLTESGGALASASEQAAQTAVTLCLVDGELLAYATATLTAPYNYNLTGLQRGLYGTTPAAHSSGAAFYRIDGTVAEVQLPTQFIGVEIWLKFQGFNIFGNGLQSLADCTAYPYTPTGIGYTPPGDVTFTVTGVNLNAAPDTDTAIAINLPPTVSQYQIVSVLLYGASESLTVAEAGLFTAPAQGGTAIAALQSLSAITSGTPDTPGNAMFLTLAVSDATIFTSGTLYFNLGTAQGSAATVNVAVTVAPFT